MLCFILLLWVLSKTAVVKHKKLIGTLVQLFYAAHEQREMCPKYHKDEIPPNLLSQRLSDKGVWMGRKLLTPVWTHFNL